MEFSIIKASGEREPFKEEKIRSSLIRSGAPVKLADKIVRETRDRLKPQINSREIYNYSKSRLQKDHLPAAARYSLKRAIMGLGPAGHLFEKYVGRVLEEYGYEVKVGQVIKGYCVSHEVDVIARKDNLHFMIECKYHNRPGTRSDVKVALYVHSRFLDVEKAWENKAGHEHMFHQAWLVTNTKCTSDAVKYGLCAGLKIIAWRYPQKGSLEQLIEQKQLYPVTVVPAISGVLANKLGLSGIFLAKDLLARPAAELARLINSSRAASAKIQKLTEVMLDY